MHTYYQLIDISYEGGSLVKIVPCRKPINRIERRLPPTGHV
jgi:hypothetical protein